MISIFGKQFVNQNTDKEIYQKSHYHIVRMMSTTSTRNENTFLEITRRVLIEQYGVSGYASIIKTAIKKIKMSENQILANANNFTKTIEFVFGEVGSRKILDPVMSELKRSENSILANMDSFNTDYSFEKNQKSTNSFITI